MARFRSIDSDIWANPRFRKLPDRAQKVFLYLFSSAADDQGRFRADPADILDAAFHRGNSTTAEKISDDLTMLEQSGLILLYGNGEALGFLLGWFEHQSITKPSESTLPPPPVEIHSWRVAEEIKAAYCAETGKNKQGVYYRDAVRWQAGKSHSTETQVRLDSNSTETRPEGNGREWKGMERNGEDRDGLSAFTASDSAATAPTRLPATAAGNDAHLRAANNLSLNLTISQLCPAIPTHGPGKKTVQDWGLAISRAADDVNYPLDMEQLLDALQANPPSFVEWPADWVLKRQKEHERIQDHPEVRDPGDVLQAQWEHVQAERVRYEREQAEQAAGVQA